jgi:FMN phosphatase YigB (HAD superfamily)
MVHAQPAGIVFLLDVDNTLLDNDRVTDDLRRHLEEEVGTAYAQRYWTIFERLRNELGYADYLGALQQYRIDAVAAGGDHQPLLTSSFLVDYPFADRLYPDALAVIAHLGAIGTTVILTDGDVVFQPRKIVRSGLWDAVGGRVLIYIHKESMLEEVQRVHPARRYVMVDDKLRLLTAMKQTMGERLMTVFVRQGHYAADRGSVAQYPAADRTIERIGDLLTLDLAC